MWKYVGQRLKDSAEQTCSHLKNLRSTFSTCSEKTAKTLDEHHERQYEFRTCDGRVYNVWTCMDGDDTSKNQLLKKSFHIDAPYLIQKCYQKQKQKQQDPFDGRLEYNFLQWTAGILCSLYFGQMLCFYTRRRQNLKRWHHMEQMLSERTLRQTLDKFNQSHFQRSFVPSNDVHHWYDADQMRGMRALMTLLPVTNDHLSSNSIGPSTVTLQSEGVTETVIRTAKNRSDVSLAVDDLIATLGSIEFRLGMQNLRANEPEIAVSHLKLATSHRHAEATYNLGVCYETGVGVERNMKNAMECYRAAASLGNKKAMFNLGVFYVHGRGGLKKNRDAARACFNAAKKMGLREAAIALSIPEKRQIKQDEEVFWKSNDLIAGKLNTIQQNDSVVI